MVLAAEPWPHLQFDAFLPPAMAEEVAANWPTEGFQWLRHSDIAMSDGTSLRKYQMLRDRFPAVDDLLRGPETEAALRDELGVNGRLYPFALLVEDLPGYRIRRHTDCAGKVISSQVYLAQDDQHADLGVILQTRDGEKQKQIPYLFNHGYAFKVTDHSWHRVAKSTAVRRSIQLIYYSTPKPSI